MSGGSKKQTVGYWYKRLWHAGLCKGPIDAFLEFRGADKTAWKGSLTASGTLTIDQPKLWGGEKDQGGIVSDVDVMFGEATQAPNAYLLANLGDQIPAWRGLTAVVFKGGKYGAINPGPQKPAFKVRRIKQGWDGGSAWYPEKAEIVMPIQLSDFGIVPGGICVLRWDQSSFHAWDHDLARMGIEFLDGAGAAISAVYADMIGTPNHVWTPRSVTGAVPAGAAMIKLVMEMQRLSGSNNDGYIRRIALSVAGAPSADVENPSADDGTPAGWINQVGWLGIFGNIDGPGYMFMGGVNEFTAAYQLWPRGLAAMNPAHALYYSRTSADAGREPTANIDAASLTAAADTLHAEGFGICTTRDPSQESPEEFEDRISKLIDGSFSRDPITGKWHLDLARGDYVLAELPILADDDIIEFREIPATLENAVNSVSITYFDPEKKETITTPPVQAMALVAEFGTIHQTIEYLEIPTAALAARVAQRELNARATPTRAYELVCTRRPYAWRPGTYFRLQVPKRGIADLVCILAEKQSGSLRSGAIRIKATQDIYSLPSVAWADVDPGVDTGPSQAPSPIVLQAAFEAPYVVVVAGLAPADLAAVPDGAGYLLVAAADPAASINYTLVVDAGAGYAEVANGDWCPTGIVSAAAVRTTTAITVTGATRLDEVLVGSIALWDAEIVRVDAINPSTGAATVARGCADTVPAEHASGSRLWFFGGNEVSDPTEYTAAETISAKLLTNTGSQQLAVGLATAMPVTFADRITRPYPPGNVKIASADWPASVSGSFTVTWAHRDRVLQSDQIVDTTAASIGPADNIRYGLRFRRLDTNAVLVERTDIGPPTATVTLTYTGNCSIELWTIDDSGVSWQSHLHTFSYTPPASPTDTITATPYTPVFGGTIIDGGDLDA